MCFLSDLNPDLLTFPVSLRCVFYIFIKLSAWVSFVVYFALSFPVCKLVVNAALRFWSRVVWNVSQDVNQIESDTFKNLVSLLYHTLPSWACSHHRIICPGCQDGGVRCGITVKMARCDLWTLMERFCCEKLCWDRGCSKFSVFTSSFLRSPEAWMVLHLHS